MKASGHEWTSIAKLMLTIVIGPPDWTDCGSGFDFVLRVSTRVKSPCRAAYDRSLASSPAVLGDSSIAHHHQSPDGLNTVQLIYILHSTRSPDFLYLSHTISVISEPVSSKQYLYLPGQAPTEFSRMSGLRQLLGEARRCSSLIQQTGRLPGIGYGGVLKGRTQQNHRALASGQHRQHTQSAQYAVRKHAFVISRFYHRGLCVCRKWGLSDI